MDSKTANNIIKDLKKICEKYGLPHHFMVMADEEECIKFIFCKQEENDNEEERKASY